MLSDFNLHKIEPSCADTYNKYMTINGRDFIIFFLLGSVGGKPYHPFKSFPDLNYPVY